jgi:hypothetical protein
MDLIAFDDLDLFGAECATPLDELEQDLYHRLIEPAGSNIDDPNRGLGIEDLLSGPYDAALAGRIEAELRKDSRVSAVRATITDLQTGSNAGTSFRITVDVKADEGELGMTLSFDSLGLRRVS